MGKKAKKPAAGSVEISEADALAIAGFKEEGTKCFGRKEYTKAIESYEKAIKLLPEGHNDKALLHSNKAACHMMLKKYKESINDCTAALDVQPSYFKALCRRAKAYEQLGLYKQALSDIQKANKSEMANNDTAEAEKRLRDVISGKRPAANGVGKPGRKAPARQQPPFYVQAKCVLDDETRVIHMGPGVTYAELLDAVKVKFPGSGPVVLKFLDRDGDLLTISSKDDLHKAMADLIESERANHGPKLPSANSLPAMRIQLVKVASEEQVPQPPMDEQLRLQQLKAAQEAYKKRIVAEQKQQAAKEAEEVYELDEWLVEFAQLFRDSLNIDSDKHLELHSLGYEKCTQALDAAVQSEKALPLFDKAAERFQEVTANGLLNWGNVHMCVGRKYLDEVATKGDAISTVEKKVEAELKKAEERYNQSLQFKPDYYDSFVAMAQLYAERAKITAGFVFANPRSEAKEGEDVKAAEQAALQLQLAATNEALKKLSKRDVERAKGNFEKALKFFEKAFANLPKEEAKEGAKEGESKEGATKQAEAPKEGAQDEVSLRAHTLVLWGNLLYEISQVRAAVGIQWKPLLDDAVAKFREAGCSEADIRQALLNHSKKEEIEIPPEPEAPKQEEGEEVKGGLAALPKKK